MGLRPGTSHRLPGLPLLQLRDQAARVAECSGHDRKKAFKTKACKPEAELVFFMNQDEQYYPDFMMGLWKEGVGQWW